MKCSNIKDQFVGAQKLIGFYADMEGLVMVRGI